MGHSSINVSLTYLRGLEIAELKRRRYAYGLVFLSKKKYVETVGKPTQTFIKLSCGV
jgi:hypothetical protein